MLSFFLSFKISLAHLVRITINHQVACAHSFITLHLSSIACHQIRARAQEHSAHVVLVKKSNVVKSKVLDAQIATCLIRAAENRAALIRQTQNRIAVDNARKEKIRKTQAEGAARASMDAFWELDRKLQSAARRRKSHVEEIKERAQSPTDNV